MEPVVIIAIVLGVVFGAPLLVFSVIAIGFLLLVPLIPIILIGLALISAGMICCPHVLKKFNIDSRNSNFSSWFEASSDSFGHDEL